MKCAMRHPHSAWVSRFECNYKYFLHCTCSLKNSKKSHLHKSEHSAQLLLEREKKTKKTSHLSSLFILQTFHVVLSKDPMARCAFRSKCGQIQNRKINTQKIACRAFAGCVSFGVSFSWYFPDRRSVIRLWRWGIPARTRPSVHHFMMPNHPLLLMRLPVCNWHEGNRVLSLFCVYVLLSSCVCGCGCVCVCSCVCSGVLHQPTWSLPIFPKSDLTTWNQCRIMLSNVQAMLWSNDQKTSYLHSYSRKNIFQPSLCSLALQSIHFRRVICCSHVQAPPA